MNKFFAAISRAPKRTAGLAIIAAAVLVPAALFAWGPDRPTFTMEVPASYVTFNSITNNPTQGDERNFVQIKEDTAPASAYGENVTLQPGKTYDVYSFYHNNAASNLNDAAHNYAGIAKNAFMRTQMPATVKSGEKARITSFVGASNSNPSQVWDEAYATATSDVALRYVPNSAVIHSNGAVNGATLPDSLFTTGTPLGYDKLDGTVPGCNQYAGYVVYKFTVDQPNFEVTKQVSKNGANTYGESVTVNPGDEVQYKIQYKNNGTTQQNDVAIRDALPAGVSYVAGTTEVSNSKTNGQWTKTIDGVTSPSGLAIGAYAPTGNAYVKFTAKIADNDKLAKCGVNTLVNTATAVTNNGNKSDTANVVVSKTCAPGTPVLCTVPGKETLPVNSPDCVTAPVTELPTTGMTENIVSVLGLGALIAAIAYYVTSRRAVAQR
ncbi:MAG: LPXTG cell wall anchor domain-containing protein [Candidatus Saccharimonadales bacterium]